MDQVYLSNLRDVLIKRFNDTELRTLCFDLGVDYESLSGRGKAARAQGLIEHAVRHGLISKLVAIGKQQRHDIDWDGLGDVSLVDSPPDTATIAAVVDAVAAAIDRIDKMADQLDSFLTGSSEPPQYRQFKQEIEASGSEIVAKEHGEVVQRITADDLRKLPPAQLKHVFVLEKAMENHYALWAENYPKRNASPDPAVNAKVSQRLEQIVSDMSDDLNGILSFLESCGFWLDDHYMHVRDAVSRAKKS